MKPIAFFLVIAATAGLAACGKSEEAAAPATSAPAAEAPPAAAPAEAPVAAAVPETAPVVTATPPVEPAAPVPPPAPAAPAAAVKAPAPVAAPAAPEAAAAPEPVAPAAPAPVADLSHGQKIYRQACAFCHDRGVAGAPKTGDAAAWSARLAQGMDTLYSVAIRGKGAMPAKGGNPSLSEADVTAAVDYMVAQSR